MHCTCANPPTTHIQISSIKYLSLSLPPTLHTCQEKCGRQPIRGAGGSTDTNYRAAGIMQASGGPGAPKTKIFMASQANQRAPSAPRATQRGSHQLQWHSGEKVYRQANFIKATAEEAAQFQMFSKIRCDRFARSRLEQKAYERKTVARYFASLLWCWSAGGYSRQFYTKNVVWCLFSKCIAKSNQ